MTILNGAHIPPGGTIGQILKKSSNANYDLEWVDQAGGSEAFPVGALFISYVATDPNALLGYGTWAALGTGRMLIGVDSGNPAIDAAGKTTGALSATPTGAVSQPTFTGSSANTNGVSAGTPAGTNGTVNFVSHVRRAAQTDTTYHIELKQTSGANLSGAGLFTAIRIR